MCLCTDNRQKSPFKSLQTTYRKVSGSSSRQLQKCVFVFQTVFYVNKLVKYITCKIFEIKESDVGRRQG